jgi:hypothetical protein
MVTLEDFATPRQPASPAVVGRLDMRATARMTSAHSVEPCPECQSPMNRVDVHLSHAACTNADCGHSMGSLSVSSNNGGAFLAGAFVGVGLLALFNSR